MLWFACSSSSEPKSAPSAPAPAGAPSAPAASAPRPAAAERFAADTPRTTVAGNRFIAPAEWGISVRGPSTILEAPEGDSWIALVDVKASTAEQAIELAWKAYKPAHPWPLKASMPAPDKDGWTKLAQYVYTTSPDEKRGVGVDVRFAGDTWTVTILDLAEATGQKRSGQIALIFGKLLPKGFDREAFAGKPARPLDAARIAELGTFIETGQRLLGVPGVALGLVQGGKVVFAGGFGVRELGKPAKVDADTRFLIASNTTALTTLMLAKLVDEKKLTWETPATALLPKFKLGDADTTSKVLVKHLICACAGMPQQGLEWLFELKHLTPDGVLAALGKMQPTSKLGEQFQHSNPLAAAAGFLGGHVAFPKLELGAAYDAAMRTRVFEPLGMKSTTFDFRQAQTGNFAVGYTPDIDDKTVRATAAVNYAAIPVRPAGGAWSTVRDLLRYVQMELDEGKLPGGRAYLAKETLLARRAPQIAIDTDLAYGMGLMVQTKSGVTVVDHGGDLTGFHSDMMWLPEYGVGAVVLTNGDGGQVIRGLFLRKLLEVLFRGHPEADTDLAAAAKQLTEKRAAARKLLEIPANAAEAAKLAPRYASLELGELVVKRKGAALVFDFGELASEVASRKAPDGSISYVTIAPGIDGQELVPGSHDGKRTLILRDAQHEYVFEER
ncbi:MAG TPA: serine hydrolase domain-containing protein [Kofleriaceae bacterium]|nr:serine hydrolase domain-containing protein [Kofleriaceae bacterium]